MSKILWILHISVNVIKYKNSNLIKAEEIKWVSIKKKKIGGKEDTFILRYSLFKKMLNM